MTGPNRSRTAEAAPYGSNRPIGKTGKGKSENTPKEKTNANSAIDNPHRGSSDWLDVVEEKHSSCGKNKERYHNANEECQIRVVESSYEAA